MTERIIMVRGNMSHSFAIRALDWCVASAVKQARRSQHLSKPDRWQNVSADREQILVMTPQRRLCWPIDAADSTLR